MIFIEEKKEQNQITKKVIVKLTYLYFGIMYIVFYMVKIGIYY